MKGRALEPLDPIDHRQLGAVVGGVRGRVGLDLMPAVAAPDDSRAAQLPSVIGGPLIPPRTNDWCAARGRRRIGRLTKGWARDSACSAVRCRSIVTSPVIAASGAAQPVRSPHATQREPIRYSGARPDRRSVGLSGSCLSSHRSDVRKASQRFVSFNACNTEDTNHKLEKSSIKVASSNQ